MDRNETVDAKFSQTFDQVARTVTFGHGDGQFNCRPVSTWDENLCLSLAKDRLSSDCDHLGVCLISFAVEQNQLLTLADTHDGGSVVRFGFGQRDLATGGRKLRDKVSDGHRLTQ